MPFDKPNLDAPPPAKLPKAQQVTQAIMGEGETAGSPGIGSGGSTATALEGVAMMIMGAQKLGNVLPGAVPPQIAQYLEILKQTVPQAMQQLQSGGGLPQAGAMPPPSMAPPPSPMGGAPMGGMAGMSQAPQAAPAGPQGLQSILGIS
jgi:hypothetical protein